MLGTQWACNLPKQHGLNYQHRIKIVGLILALFLNFKRVYPHEGKWAKGHGFTYFEDLAQFG